MIKSKLVKKNKNKSIKRNIKKKKKDYFGALKGIDSFTKEDEMEDRF